MSLFHVFHLFIDWSELVGVACLLVGVVGLRFSLFCLVADQSLRSSCLPMTNLAQLHDCHSCYDERSIDQKKIDQKKGIVNKLALVLNYSKDQPLAHCPNFLGVLFGCGCWVVCVGVFVLCFVFVGDTLIFVSPFLSYGGIANSVTPPLAQVRRVWLKGLGSRFR